MVDTIDKGRASLIFGGSGEDDLLCTSLKMESTFSFLEESSGTFADDVNSSITPFYLGRVFFSVNSDFLSIDDDALVPFLDG